MPSLPLVCSLVILAGVLVAVVRSHSSRDMVAWTAPAAVLVLATDLVDLDAAADTTRDLAPTLLFLAAMFVVAQVADAAGLFDLAAQGLARAGHHSESALLVAVATGAVAVTTVLSLDATAVLFTPVVVAATRHRPSQDRSLLATVFLANGASLLLPVANLTNLLALDQLDLGVPAFAARMALPTLAAAVVTTIGCRVLTPPAPGTHGSGHPEPAPSPPSGFSPDPAPSSPRPSALAPLTARGLVDRSEGGSVPQRRPTMDATIVALGLAVLLVAFVGSSVAGVEPVAVAAVGAVVLGAIAAARRCIGPVALARSVDVGFLAFVAALGVVVSAPAEQGLTRFVADRLPSGTGLGSLLLVAFGAALLANVVTNLPATLVLLPALAGRPSALLLAALIGVNIGPNLTVTGSLATLLWRRVVRAGGVEPPLRSFARVTVVTTPLAIAAATLALWTSLRLVA